MNLNYCTVIIQKKTVQKATKEDCSESYKMRLFRKLQNETFQRATKEDCSESWKRWLYFEFTKENGSESYKRRLFRKIQKKNPCCCSWHGTISWKYRSSRINKVHLPSIPSNGPWKYIGPIMSKKTGNNIKCHSVACNGHHMQAVH